MQQVPQMTYAGIHKIVWKDIKFPASGTYTVDIHGG